MICPPFFFVLSCIFLIPLGHIPMFSAAGVGEAMRTRDQTSLLPSIFSSSSSSSSFGFLFFFLPSLAFVEVKNNWREVEEEESLRGEQTLQRGNKLSQKRKNKSQACCNCRHLGERVLDVCHQKRKRKRDQ